MAQISSAAQGWLDRNREVDSGGAPGVPPGGSTSAAQDWADRNLGSDDGSSGEPSWLDAAISTGLRVAPAVAGDLAGATLAPFTGGASIPIAGGAGAGFGELMAQAYEQRNTPGFDPNEAQLAIAAAAGMVPLSWMARGGSAALRSTLPRVARVLGSKGAVGAGTLERLRHELPREIAKGVGRGAPLAAVEGAASRHFQEGQQAIDPKAIGRDLTMGALFGSAVPLVSSVVPHSAKLIASNRGEGFGPLANRYLDINDPEIARNNAYRTVRGQPTTENTSATASQFNLHGTKDKQLVDIQKLLDQSELNITKMASQKGVRYIEISDIAGVRSRLRKAHELRANAEGQRGRAYADEIKRLDEAIVGNQISLQDAIKLKRLLDKERPTSSFNLDAEQTVDSRELSDISDQFRADIKRQMPEIGDILNTEKRLIDLQYSLSKYDKKLSLNDFLYSGIGGGALGSFGGGSNVIGGAAAGVGVRMAAKSPRIRSNLARSVNFLAGNKVEGIPPVVDLPKGPTPPRPSSWTSGSRRSPGWVPPVDSRRRRSSKTETPPPPGSQGRRSSSKTETPPPPGSQGRRRSSKTETPPPGGQGRRTSSIPKTKTQAYTVLGVQPTASPDEIKKAYRDLSKTWHPDKVAGKLGDMLDPGKRAAKEALRKKHNEMMQAINAAWTLLKK